MTDEEKEMKEWIEQRRKGSDLMSKLLLRNEELQKENAELKDQLKNNPYVELLQKEKSEMAEDFAKQTEKMKLENKDLKDFLKNNIIQNTNNFLQSLSN